MKVYGKCKSCSCEIAYRTDAHTRVEFAMQDGETKILNCKNCGTNTELHVDKLYANTSKMPLIITGLIILIGVPLTLFLIFFGENDYVIIAFGIPLVAYFILSQQDQARVSDFNRRKFKGRVHNIG